MNNLTRRQRIETRKKFFVYGSIIAGLVILVLAGSFLLRLFGFYKTIQTDPGTKPVITKEKDSYNFLLLGYGGGNHEGTFLTDTLIIANVNLKTKKVLMISVPRDIWVKVPTSDKEEVFYSKINSVYQMGLFPENYPGVDGNLITDDNASGLIKKVAENITGLPIDAFLAVDFEGFMKAIDTLGGIEVDVQRSFTDYEYPVEGKENDLCGKTEEDLPELEKIATESPVLAFPCRYETLEFSKGMTEMDGSTALKFARSRHSLEDGGDFNRAQRQQLVIEGAKQKVLRVDFLPKIIPLLDQLEEHIVTDLPLGDLNKLLLEARNANSYSTQTLVLSENNFLTSDRSDDGQYIIVPNAGRNDWSEVKKEVDNIIKGITPTPTRNPKLTPKVSPKTNR
ncbi:MAG: LCP family protein [Weeksellaceae bacterium]